MLSLVGLKYLVSVAMIQHCHCIINNDRKYINNGFFPVYIIYISRHKHDLAQKLQFANPGLNNY